jgi:long-chain acyl-CoA synthetase
LTVPSRGIERIEPVDAPTLAALFAERVRRSPDHVAYRDFIAGEAGWRAWTWQEMERLVGRWRAGFAASGLQPGDRVAILARNGVAWVCADLAAAGLGLVTVPMHVGDGVGNWSFVIGDSSPRLLVVGEAAHWQVLAARREPWPELETVVLLEAGADHPDGAVRLADWLPDHPVAEIGGLAADDLVTITYTSGTTGRPKGVMLTHRNLIAAADAVLRRNPGGPGDVFLSFLPLAHIYGRTTEYYLAMSCGGEVAFARSIADLPQDFAAIRPTVMMGVPRVFERLWKSVLASASRPPGRWLLARALALGPQRGRAGLIERMQRRLIGRLITARLIARFGGRLRLAVCGGAPLSADLARSLRAIGLPLVEGYGLAEAAGPVTGDAVNDYLPGAVGRPLDGTEIRIAGNGEILIRSASVMAGYWRRADETARAVDARGWLHTGDLGTIREGRLVVQGRLRDVIVLSTGEKVAPSGIESRIVTDPLFLQAVVLGDRLPAIMALVVLDRERWADFAAAHGLDPAEPDTSECERLLLGRIASLCAGLPPYAQVRRVSAGLEPWTIADGLLTVTLKVRRDAVAARFRDRIDVLRATMG